MIVLENRRWREGKEGGRGGRERGREGREGKERGRGGRERREGGGREERKHTKVGKGAWHPGAVGQVSLQLVSLENATPILSNGARHSGM